MMTESARLAWRKGFLPQLPTAGLEALRAALIADDDRLIQNSTTCPPPLACMANELCEGACAVSFALWQSRSLSTVEQVEEAFGRACFETDFTLGEPSGSRYFLNWFDDTPRETMRRALLAEIEIALTARQLALPPAA